MFDPNPSGFAVAPASVDAAVTGFVSYPVGSGFNRTTITGRHVNGVMSGNAEISQVKIPIFTKILSDGRGTLRPGKLTIIEVGSGVLGHTTLINSKMEVRSRQRIRF